MGATSLLTFKNKRTIAKEKLTRNLRTALDDAEEMLQRLRDAIFPAEATATDVEKEAVHG